MPNGPQQFVVREGLTVRASASDAPAGLAGRWRILEQLLAASPALVVAGAMLRSSRRHASGRLASRGLLGRFSVSAMPRDLCLVPGVPGGPMQNVSCRVDLAD